MSLDFLPFLKHVPFIDRIWKEMANRVMGEDLVLVQGQQKRMSLGGDTWANPVSYDKMGVRYRRWRNSLSSDDVNEKRAASDALRSGSMSAGELFSVDEDASP
jgi:chlorophyllide a oxygenase